MTHERKLFFTSESVTEGHPDKLADLISDNILDGFLSKDKSSKVAVETLLTNGLCIIAGEVTSQAMVDVTLLARETIKDVGYKNNLFGFDGDSCGVLLSLSKQSPDIAQGVVKKEASEQGAGDQGLMFGYACNETKELMPAPIMYAHKLAKRLAILRKNDAKSPLGPDGKTQVTVMYEGIKPIAITSVVVSSQHKESFSQEDLKALIIDEVINKTIDKDFLASDAKFFINPTGKFVIGGPKGDTGLTGRKIIVDTYGGMGRHGGGAFSGKDPSKVDRSSAYFARYIAKNIVAANIAHRAEVQISYAIGVPKPTSFMVNTFGTSQVSEEKIEKAIAKLFSLTPYQIIEKLNLLNIQYKDTAKYGHFGWEDVQNRPWEKTDMVEELKSLVF